jgi:hypothetical protein
MTVFASWIQSENSLSLASCSITELGFARVLAQAPACGFTVTQARTVLLRLKRVRTLSLAFIRDEHDVLNHPVGSGPRDKLPMAI